MRLYASFAQGQHPCQNVNGQFGTTCVRVTFSLRDLKQTRQNLGKLSDDPDKNIETFKEFTQICELDWKVTVLHLNQTLACGPQK